MNSGQQRKYLQKNKWEGERERGEKDFERKRNKKINVRNMSGTEF